MTYSQLIHGLTLAGITLDRKVLSDIAVRDPETFRRFAERRPRGFGCRTHHAESNTSRAPLLTGRRLFLCNDDHISDKPASHRNSQALTRRDTRADGSLRRRGRGFLGSGCRRRSLTALCALRAGRQIRRTQRLVGGGAGAAGQGLRAGVLVSGDRRFRGAVGLAGRAARGGTVGARRPGNVGTIVRSAQAFGASCVALGPGTADPHGRKAVRASMGAIFGTTLARVGGLAELPGQLVALVPGRRRAAGGTVRADHDAAARRRTRRSS